MLFIPHFSHSVHVNPYMKQLLVIFHRGFLLLDQPYLVNAESISRIIGLPNEGNDLVPYLAKKDIKPIKWKHNLQWASGGYLIGPIQDKSVCVSTKISSYKMFHKMIPMQCSTKVVELAYLCALGGKFNWSWYMLNALVDDVMQAQHKEDHKFHYLSCWSWICSLCGLTHQTMYRWMSY